MKYTAAFILSTFLFTYSYAQQFRVKSTASSTFDQSTNSMVLNDTGYHIYKGGNLSNIADTVYGYEPLGSALIYSGRHYNIANGKSYTSIFEKWDNLNQKHVPTFKYDHIYNLSGKEVKYVRYKWDNVATKWTPEGYDTTVYNSSGDIISFSTYIYNLSNNSFEPFRRSVGFYSVNYGPDSSKDQYYIGGSWRDTAKLVYTYLVSSVCRSYILNKNGSNWDTFRRNFIEYFQPRKIKVDSMEFKAGISWQAFTKHVCLYNSNGDILKDSTLVNDNGIMKNWYMYQHDYDVNHNKTRYVLFGKWDDVNKKWMHINSDFEDRYYYETYNHIDVVSPISPVHKFWPVPAKDNMHLLLDNVLCSEIVINIYGISGNLEYHTALPVSTPRMTESIPVEGLSQGIHVIEVRGDNWSLREKIQITH